MSIGVAIIFMIGMIVAAGLVGLGIALASFVAAEKQEELYKKMVADLPNVMEITMRKTYEAISRMSSEF